MIINIVLHFCSGNPMKKILVLLFFGLVLFGCLGGSSTTGNQTTGGTTGGTPSGGGTTGGGVNSYATAVATGMPYSCTFSMGGDTQTAYIKGQNMYIVGTSGGQPVEVISTPTISYVKLTAEAKQSFQQVGKTCDWLSVTQQGQAQGGSSSFQPPDMSSYTSPDVQWTCSAAAFGDEKFQPSGSVCSMQDLTSAYANQNPPAQ